MSGGSFDYLYRQLWDMQELSIPWGDLADAIKYLENNKHRYGDDTAVDEMLCLLRPLHDELKAIAVRLYEIGDPDNLVGELLYDIEWECSGDYSKEQVIRRWYERKQKEANK